MPAAPAAEPGPALTATAEEERQREYRRIANDALAARSRYLGAKREFESSLVDYARAAGKDEWLDSKGKIVVSRVESVPVDRANAAWPKVEAAFAAVRASWTEAMVRRAALAQAFAEKPFPEAGIPLIPGALWVGALLSSLLAIEFLFRDDARDGTLEQFALSGQSFAWLLLAKTASHWLLTGLPLALAAPLAAVGLGAPAAAIPGILAALLLGSVSLSLIGAIGAGLTLGIRRGGALLSLLVLPLAIPTLVFGARATDLAIRGEPLGAPLYLLAALAVFGLTLAPLAAAAAVRISLE
jgi:heme exporter protein B